MKTTQTLATASSSPSSSVTITTEAVGAIGGIIVSLVAVGTLCVQAVTKFNNLSNSIKEINNALKDHISREERLNKRVDEVEKIENKLDIHIQDYVNRKDTVQMLIGQLNEKIDHKFNRIYNSMKQLEGYLQREGNFRIREYSDEKSE